MAKSVEHLLSDPERGRLQAMGILCWMFRNVLVWRQVNLHSWRKRLKRYFEKPHNQNLDGQGRKPDRGNLNSDLIKDDFTWGNFKKAVDFLDPVSATFSVALTWHDDRVTEHHIKIDPAEDETDSTLNEFSVDTTDSELFKDRSDCKSTLARLFRRIIIDEGIDLERWDELLRAHIKNPHNGYDQSPRALASARSTLQKELLEERMTWAVFRKAMLVLKPKRVEYGLLLRWARPKDDVTYSRVTDRVV